MKAVRTNSEMNLDSEAALLKVQVNLIRLSKVIKDPIHLKEKTGITMSYVHYILKNQEKILDKWKQHLKNSSSRSTYSDECDGIDILLLEWVTRCKLYKIKLTSTTIKRHLMYLSRMLKISPPYKIKASMLSRIEKILHDESSVRKMSYLRTLKSYTPLQILKEDGSTLLKPEVYKKFLRTLKGNSSDEKNKKENIGEAKKYSIKTRYQTKESATKEQLQDDVYFKVSSTGQSTAAEEINTNPAPVSKHPIAFKTPMLHHNRINDEAMSPLLIKKEMSYYAEDKKLNEFEFIDICHDKQPVINEVLERPLPVCAEVQQSESELKANRDTSNLKIVEFHKCTSEIKEEPELIIDDGVEVIEIFDDDMDGSKDADVNRTETDQIEKARANNLCPPTECLKQLIHGDNEATDELQILFELEGCDEEEKQELMKIINEHTSANPEQEKLIIAKTDIRESFYEDNESEEEEFLTVLEIVSDNEDDTNMEQNVLLKELFQNSESLHRNAVERISEIGDNLPSTSKSATLDVQPKRLRLNSTQSLDYTNLTINSNVEAFKYLHCIKHYFKSQNDKEASTLVSNLIMTFMMHSATIVSKGSGV